MTVSIDECLTDNGWVALVRIKNDRLKKLLETLNLMRKSTEVLAIMMNDNSFATRNFQNQSRGAIPV